MPEHVRCQPWNTFLFISGIMLDSWTRIRKLSEPALVYRCGLFTDSRREELELFCMQWLMWICWRNVIREWGRGMACHTPQRTDRCGYLWESILSSLHMPRQNYCTLCVSTSVCQMRMRYFHVLNMTSSHSMKTAPHQKPNYGVSWSEIARFMHSTLLLLCFAGCNIQKL